jgi:serine/threonine protein kinase
LSGFDEDALLQALDAPGLQLSQDNSGFIGAYQVLGRVGVGGMGTVFKARSIHPEREGDLVAIKVLHAQTEQQELLHEHFRAEAYLLSLLDHKNVIRTFESGVHNGQFYLVMDFVAGVDLRTMMVALDDLGLRLPVPLALYITDRLLEALAYTHAATDTTGKPLLLVHRDICPENVFLSASGEVLLGDFGIALHGAVKSAKQVLHAGHLGYMAPEQLDALPVDQRTDLFAASCLWFRLLTGREAFANDDFETAYKATVKARLPSLDHLDGALAARIRALADVAFQRKPKNRFQTAAELRQAFTEAFGPIPDASGLLSGLVRTMFSRRVPPPAPLSPNVQVAEVILLCGDPECEDELSALLFAAGFSCHVIESPSVLSARTGLPVVASLASQSPAQIDALAQIGVASLLVLAGALTQDSLATLARVPNATAVLFAPFTTEQVAFALKNEIVRRLNLANPIAKANGRVNAIDGRRVLAIGLDAAAGRALADRCHAIGVLCEVLDAEQASADYLAALAAARSHHLVLVCARTVDPAMFGLVSTLRAQPGYDTVPAVLAVDDVGNADRALSSTPAAVDFLYGTSQPSDLAKKIKSVLESSTQRSFRRLPHAMKVSFAYRGIGFEARALNISRMGLLVAAKETLPMGSVLQLSLTAIPGEDPVYVTARVVHIQLGTAQPSGDVLLGLDFIKVGSNDEQRWLSLVYGVAAAVPK